MSLKETTRTERRNVVLIHLESTRARSVTPYNEDLETTPFLNELAKSSLLAERAYTTVPRTSKAIISVNCGIQPHLVEEITEARQGGIPSRGLADLLNEQRYSTAFFQSSTENFENFRDLVKNFGYAEYYPLESLDEKYVEGFEWANYFGYEDDIMLKPSKDWLKMHRDQSFMVTYLMGTGHHDYQAPSRYGYEKFSEEEPLNSYLNCLRYQDFFVKNLINQYQELGYYEDTIFVLYGDHGEGFGEHGRWQHEDVIWEEEAKVPLIIHAPGWFEDGKRVEGLSNHTDILPTVLDMLGYELIGEQEYPGYSLLHPLPEDRTLFFSCFHDDKKGCASLRGTEKYIYHYEELPEEVFDLSEDPFEENNIVNERDEQKIRERRNDIIAWRARVNAIYEGRIVAG
jgi:lipoteichoic acid synthase